MSKFMNFLKRHSKKLAILTVVSVAAVGVSTIAWGPDRPTYTVNSPADHITFNSITDNPNVGDERNFVVVKDAANTSTGGWQDNVTVESGKEYLVRMYVHNNAASSLNLTAVNTRVSATVPTTTGLNVPLSGFVSADNAQPAKVWDDVNFNSTQNFNLAYVAGSARIYNNGYAAGGNGQALPDSIVTAAGALVGYNGPNGQVPGCFQYANYVTFKVKPQFATPNTYDLTKMVRKSGETEWKETVAIKAGDVVDYQIRYTNTGGSAQNSVVVVDKLPAGLTLVPNSTFLKNSNHNTNDFKPENQTGIVSGGLSIGNYAAGGVGYVKFSAKASDMTQLKCGANTLKNWAYGSPAGSPSASDDADVTIDKECQPETPVYECTALTAEKIGDKNYRFTTAVKTGGGVTVNKYTYNFGDNSTEFNTTSNTATHQYAAAGTYDIVVRVLFNVGSEQKEARCTAKVTIPTTPETPETPETPRNPVIEVLPSTGPVEVVAGIFGTSAVAYGAYAFLESRRALKNVK